MPLRHPPVSLSQIIDRPLAPFIILLICAALGYIPFINEAIHIDGDMMVNTAMAMVTDPLDPPLDDYGRLMTLHDHTRMPQQSVYFRNGHPPLVNYLLLPAAALGGGAEWPFHLTFLLFYLAAVAAAWYLFGLFLEHRLRVAATALWTFSPALMVNSHTLMWDVPVTALIIGSLAAYLAACRSSNIRLLLLSGFLTGLGALAKTNTLPCYFVMGTALLISRRWRWLVLWCLPAVALPLLWVGHNLIVYGQIQYISIGWFNVSAGNLRYRFERIISYFGSCLVIPCALYWFMIRRGLRRGAFLCLAAAGAWALALWKVLDKEPWFALCYFLAAAPGLWLLGRTVSLFFPASLPSSSRHDRNIVAVFSLVYAALALCFPSASVRYMLPMIPFLLLAFVRVTAMQHQRHQRLFWGITIGLTALLSLLLSAGDYLVCEADRRLPLELSRRGYAAEHTWYYGRLSYAYYLDKQGYRNLRGDRERPAPGDWLLEEVIPSDYHAPEMVNPSFTLVPVDTIRLFSYPFHTKSLYAGFYGNSRLGWTWEPAAPQRVIAVFWIVPPGPGNDIPGVAPEGTPSPF